ncbi:MAG TPA: hypothetical protein VGO33_02820 [Gemmatimonadaceae bacterium]|jgi:hypothetical protein|nr:hypothetical protein [Gemmatimonadaceae bacterium]
MDIRELVARRTDLSTFLVHLTRDGDEDEDTALVRFQSIIDDSELRARSMFGQAKTRLVDSGHKLKSQKCVCFTETPLEHIHLLLEEIDNRDCQFKPYGVAIPKKVGRSSGINPVWYLDMSQGPHHWLTHAANGLLDDFLDLDEGVFTNPNVERLMPFIEQMGTFPPTNFRKEFWWEREWRHQGHYSLPSRVIGLCPEDEIPELTEYARDSKTCLTKFRFIDPRWGLERIIAHLAGFGRDDVEIL